MPTNRAHLGLLGVAVAWEDHHVALVCLEPVHILLRKTKQQEVSIGQSWHPSFGKVTERHPGWLIPCNIVQLSCAAGADALLPAGYIHSITRSTPTPLKASSPVSGETPSPCNPAARTVIHIVAPSTLLSCSLCFQPGADSLFLRVLCPEPVQSQLRAGMLRATAAVHST